MVIASKYDIGNWTVALDLADGQGELKHFTVNFQVENQPPTLNISGPTTINALDHLHLEAGPDTDSDGQTVTWLWDLLQSPLAASKQPVSGFSADKVIDFVTGPKDIGDWRFRCTAKDEGGLTTPKEVVVTVKAIPPKINIVPASPAKIKAGGTIHFETTIPNDAYGAPLKFDWELTQVPISAGVGLASGLSTAADVTVSAAKAGTWKFKLTVTDQVQQTATQEVKVLVDSDPIAVIVGPDQTDNLTLPLDLDGSSSTDDDSPNTPPDYQHLHSGAVDVSLPTIQIYQWTLLEVPIDRYGEIFPGPVSDAFNVNDTSAMLHIPAGKLTPGDWIFQLDVADAEGNHHNTYKTVQVLDASLPPLAIVLPPEVTYSTDSMGILSSDVKLDGSLSFDLDNLLQAQQSPGLGITNYAWSFLLVPPGCSNPPTAPSGANASVFTMYTAGSLVGANCQGIFDVQLQVTDDDTPQHKQNTGKGIVRIGNCASLVCLDYPTQASPQFVKFSNKTDVMIWYHMNSLVYSQPGLAAGLRLQLQIFYEGNLGNPVYNRTWDVDMFPGSLAIHWYGYSNNGQRPAPGKYTISLQVFDAAGNPAGYFATEPNAIVIQTMDVAVGQTTDTWVNYNGLIKGSDALNIHYAVIGNQGGGGPGYDELRYRIFNRNTNAKVFEGNDFGPLFNGILAWNGDLGGSNFLGAGRYQLELEILDGGASLGTSPKDDFRVYQVDAALKGIADA